MLDPSITLFGKRIQVNGDVEVEVCSNDEFSVEESNFDELHEDVFNKEITEEPMENDQLDDSAEEAMNESTNAPTVSETTDQTNKTIDSDTLNDEKELNDSKKELKKPDKLLPCPRCNSMDTKFCYYNNYNVSQPRHFCKACQRYWTAGGTMRNVPVGSGRRKNKTSASRYCHINVSEAIDVSNGVHHPGVMTNGTILTFGHDYPICENGDDRSSGSTVTTSSSIEDRSKKGVKEPKQHFNGFANQMQCFQLPYMWNPNVPFCPSAFPMPIYPHPYWNGAPIPWNVPCVPTQVSPGFNPNSPTLGKHTRNGEIISPPATSSTVMRPKTLRIDDSDDAAKSSIWSTLGIKKDKSESLRNGFFNSLQSKEEERKDCESQALTLAPSALIKANPVALCRSFKFQERA